MEKKKRNRDRIIVKCDEIPIIDPSIYYTTGQILKLGLIPGFKKDYSDLNRLYGIMLVNIDGVRYPCEETTKDKLKSINGSTIGRTNAKRLAKGSEIIKLLNLNNVLPK